MGAAAGNASEAARLAGYSKRSAGELGARLLKKVEIKSAIAAQQANDPLIATRDEVQRKVSRTLRGDEGQLGLRASELLCRMNGWLVDRQEHTGKDGGPIKVEERQVIHQHFPGGLPNA